MLVLDFFCALRMRFTIARSINSRDKEERANWVEEMKEQRTDASTTGDNGDAEESNNSIEE